MKNLHKLLFVLISILYLSGCDTSSSARPTVEKEDIHISDSRVFYNEEIEGLLVWFTSNLEEGLDVNATLYDSSDAPIATTDAVLEYFSDHETRISMPLTEEELAHLKDPDVYLELAIEVRDIGSPSKNQQFLSAVGGGTKTSVMEQYADSDDVVIVEGSTSDEFDYAMKVTADPVLIRDFELLQQAQNEAEAEAEAEAVAVVDVEEEVVEGEVLVDEPVHYSDDFNAYNAKYYQHFGNYEDLLGSNFEILAMDGFGNQNILDDLIRWTQEFDEFLDVYEDGAKPLNEVDLALYHHTLTMIDQQRTVNRNVILGLTEYDEYYLLEAANELASVVDLFLEGEDLLSRPI
ncbi:hypothetical protein [Exiguobacterium sp. SH3S1]|uniref:hypothetical protein n=1 Tax=Exiguobacterium sp. SH3S1 TaxID=2510955 RepID=UPI0010398BEA|nr:hypothetical protein [Exiguobacterium sp. SH3S1]TCI63987.1 hypothetical protein EVJ26_06220 [Exiguobacterium sp. SH3S1]